MVEHEDLKQVGEIFRARRSEMNMTVREVENATSIRAGYLTAIEEGRVEKTLSAVYLHGFLKQYANFLGLDVDKLKQEFPAAFKAPAEKHEFDYGIGTLEMRGSMGGGVKWLPNLMWGGLSVVVLVVAYYLAKALGVL